ncbi:MAG: DEAD/DEAH box helicase [Alphaproteobacteria bacterium]|nr:DEAD/DEAH box helicase [Alphaproteobacteria bacterium]
MQTMQNFDALGLPPELMGALAYMKFTTPTPIQAAAIPPALAGKDILGSAQTGTGKTGAFGIPLIARLLTNPRGTALVMTPTRELAVQVMAMMEQLLGEGSGIHTALLIGGEPMPKQFSQLRRRPRLVVGTPGRINDHLTRGTLKLTDANFLVLDETDRMLDMGFGIQIDAVVKHMPTVRQTLMFSATFPANIVKMSQKYMADPVRVSVGDNNTPIAKIKQEVITVSEADKYGQLQVQLQQREGSILVFVQTKFGAEKMAKKLTALNHRAAAIHGNLNQRQRDRVIADFRAQKCRILVATDIAARGLDIPHIEHVINYDMPQCPEDYIHRIGRTGRNGKEGQAVNLLTGKDNGKWKAIQRLLNPGAKVEGGSLNDKPRSYAKARNKKFGGKKPFRSGQRPRSAGVSSKAAA